MILAVNCFYGDSLECLKVSQQNLNLMVYHSFSGLIIIGNELFLVLKVLNNCIDVEPQFHELLNVSDLASLR